MVIYYNNIFITPSLLPSSSPSMSEVEGTFAHELDIYKYKPQLEGSYNEGEDGYISSEFDNDSLAGEKTDAEFEKIKRSVHSSHQSDDYDGSTAYTQISEDGDVAPGHCALSYGFIPKGYYEHPIKNGEILGGKFYFLFLTKILIIGQAVIMTTFQLITVTSHFSLSQSSI